MTSKTKSMWAGGFAGILLFAAYVASVGPSEQDNFIQALQACFPLMWRPEIAAIGHFVGTLCGFYALYHAAHSGPQTPPANAPQ